MNRQAVGSGPAPITRHLETNGLKVAYVEVGAGDPLILIHGAESDRHQFARLQKYLGHDCRSISYDQRDSGATTSPPEPFTMTDLAADVVHLMDALGIDRAHVLGTSYGGMIAQHVALDYPDRLASLILVSTTPTTSVRTPESERLVAMSAEERSEAFIDLLVTPEGRASPEVAAQSRRALAPRTPEQTARRRAAAANHETRNLLNSIEVPTLVIHGSDDRVTPVSWAELLAEQITHAQLRTIKGARHGLTTEFPEKIADYVRQFIGASAI
ncbi:pimeloyl-ACP methyl ester carboxylesterase [Antricoccus suffuscus]|uniref:Pimeloyl-ACP methyl ester carboxylesterase n=1 Tax=Antricoccus suffuscus TaxID=1629062 RepID=A0A2T0ZTK1_9ACTN|nr:alpha/beta hydrolase [Antricoccus suffuscus]PRZ39681.1 pimeloyl-ACP methyl ester carboxylesterase [Antricoccus suffuscus]